GFSQYRVDLDRGHVAYVREQGKGEGPQPRTDLDDDVVVGDTGDSHDTSYGAVVDDEVLSQGLGGPDVEPVGERAHVGGREQAGVVGRGGRGGAGDLTLPEDAPPLRPGGQP